MTLRSILTGAAALAAAGALAQGAPENRVGLLGETSHLDRGSDWQSLTLSASRHWSQRAMAQAQLSRTRRFGLHDDEFALGGTLPVGEAVTLGLRATHSPTHRVIARGSVGATAQWEMRKAWLLHGGLKRTNYDAVDVTQATLGVEHYFSSFGATALAHRTRAFGRQEQSYELRGAWYYTDKSSVTLFLANGDEVGQTGPGTLAVDRVRSVALAGRHAIADGPWAVQWGLHRVRQGNAYTRTGASLGVQHTF